MLWRIQWHFSRKPCASSVARPLKEGGWYFLYHSSLSYSSLEVDALTSAWTGTTSCTCITYGTCSTWNHCSGVRAAGVCAPTLAWDVAVASGINPAWARLPNMLKNWASVSWSAGVATSATSAYLPTEATGGSSVVARAAALATLHAPPCPLPDPDRGPSPGLSRLYQGAQYLIVGSSGGCPHHLWENRKT